MLTIIVMSELRTLSQNTHALTVSLQSYSQSPSFASLMTGTQEELKAKLQTQFSSYFTRTGSFNYAFSSAPPAIKSAKEQIEDESELRMDDVMDWIHEYDGNDRLKWSYTTAKEGGHMEFYEHIQTPLFSIRMSGSMTVERAAKPLKNYIWTATRNYLLVTNAQLYLKAGLNINFLVQYHKKQRMKAAKLHKVEADKK
jgi:hypothetical protein